VAYKTFVAGEEALAADVNSYLMSQTVARFASAAARTTQLPAPALNQLSLLDTRMGVVQFWNGSAWADLLGDIPFLYGGQKSVTTDGAGQFNLTFPTALAWIPTWAVMQPIGTDLLSSIANPVVSNLSATTIVGRVVDLRNPNVIIASNTFVFSYLVGAPRT
jgi:hypothetical protein